jgi:YggT family protein
MRLIANILYTILDVLKYLIFARVILSYLPISSNKFTDFVVKATEPCLGPIRMLLERYSGARSMMLDFSPFIALILISLLQALL